MTFPDAALNAYFFLIPSSIQSHTSAGPIWFIAVAESASYQSFPRTRVHKIMLGRSLGVSFNTGLSATQTDAKGNGG